MVKRTTSSTMVKRTRTKRQNKVSKQRSTDVLETVKATLNRIHFISSDASIKLHVRKNGLTNQLTQITANNMDLYRIQQLLSVISAVLETVVIQTQYQALQLGTQKITTIEVLHINTFRLIKLQAYLLASWGSCRGVRDCTPSVSLPQWQPSS